MLLILPYLSPENFRFDSRIRTTPFLHQIRSVSREARLCLTEEFPREINLASTLLEVELESFFAQCLICLKLFEINVSDRVLTERQRQRHNIRGTCEESKTLFPQSLILFPNYYCYKEYSNVHHIFFQMVLSCMKFVQGVIYNFHTGISSNTPNNHMGQSLDPSSTHSLLVMPPYMPRSIPCLLDLIRQVDCLLLVAGRRSLHSLGLSDRRQTDLK